MDKETAWLSILKSQPFQRKCLLILDMSWYWLDYLLVLIELLNNLEIDTLPMVLYFSNYPPIICIK